MFSFQFHIRDYIAKTRHLTLLEDLAYRRLIDAYYTEEGPLPPDVQACARLIAMRDHTDAVEAVLREFFVLTDAGWTNARCDYEIARYREIGSRRKRAAGLRWGAKQAPDADAMQMHSTCNPQGMPTSQPVNQSTSKPKKQPLGIAFDWESGCFTNITELHKRKWAEANPGVDVEAEIRNAEAYFVSDPERGMGVEKHGLFLRKWIDKAGGSSGVPAPKTGATLSNPFEGLA